MVLLAGQKCPAAKPNQVLIVNAKAFRTSTLHSVYCCVVDSQTGSLDVGTVDVISYIVHLLRTFHFSGRGCRCGGELKSSCFVCWAYGDSQATSGDRRLVMSDAAIGFESQINCLNCCALGSQGV
jgi:hypothetical protein